MTSPKLASNTFEFHCLLLLVPAQKRAQIYGAKPGRSLRKLQEKEKSRREPGESSGCSEGCSSSRHPASLEPGWGRMCPGCPDNVLHLLLCFSLQTIPGSCKRAILEHMETCIPRLSSVLEPGWVHRAGLRSLAKEPHQREQFSPVLLWYYRQASAAGGFAQLQSVQWKSGVQKDRCHLDLPCIGKTRDVLWN